jgi:hypothetical protein
MNKRWHYAENGKSTGPFSLEELKSILQRFSNWREVLVWREGDDQWQKAGSISDFADMRAAPPPIPKNQLRKTTTPSPPQAPNTISRKTKLWPIALKVVVSAAAALVAVIVLTSFLHATRGRSSN